MRSPGSRFEPPPSMRLMMKVEMLGTNTMVMPVVMPGMASGTSTRERMWNVCAKVLRGLDDALVYFHHNGVKRQHHERAGSCTPCPAPRRRRC